MAELKSIVDKKREEFRELRKRREKVVKVEIERVRSLKTSHLKQLENVEDEINGFKKRLEKMLGRTSQEIIGAGAAGVAAELPRGAPPWLAPLARSPRSAGGGTAAAGSVGWCGQPERCRRHG